MFITKYNFKPEQGEINSGELVTDPSGFIPQHIQIQNFIQSGQMLQAARNAAAGYDTMTDEVDNFIDPTLSAMYDPADASQALLEISERTARARDQQKSHSDGELVSGNNKSESGQSAVDGVSEATISAGS